jgi:hypothetical protein
MPPQDKEWFDFSGFIQEIEQEICAKVLGEKGRFPSVDTLVNRFRETSSKLLAEGPRKRFREFQETLTFFDVKTINPISQDDWSKYEDAIARGLFPPRVEVHLEEKWLGGEIWHGMTAARSKMLEYAIEFEEKISSCMADIGSAPVVLAFCGDEFKWHKDELEDFVDFYRTGRYRYDDTFSKMEAHHISEKSIYLTRRISRFVYFGRPNFEITPRTVCWDVRGPKWGNQSKQIA